MKQEFVAIVPTGRDGGQTVARARGMRGYSVAFDHPSLLLLVNDTGGTVSLGDAGVVVGTIFDQPARCPLEDLPVRAVQAARDSYGTSLFTQFWGGYVALLTQEDGSVAIVRDPSGSIPCWWTREGDAVIVTSAARDCVAEGLVKGAFDWESVSSHLLWPERHPSRTAIAGLEELLQGSRLQLVGADIRVDYPWTPWGFTAAGACIEKSDEAIDLVRRATLNAIHGWTKRYSSPLVSLSGGLDSSIVLAGTKGIAATAITISTNEPIGDERLYARAAAQYCAIRLVEQQLSLDDIKPEISNAVTSPRPIARLFGQGFDRLWRDVALKYGSDALFHGGGGDNVFCYLTSATPYLDSFLYNGPGVRTRATLLGLSQMTGVSTWRVRRGALRKLILDRGHYRWLRDERLLAPRAKHLGDAVGLHPWFDHVPARTLPGKRAHVAALVRIRDYLDAIAGAQDVPVVAPLMAQPVMEACLRIPSWLWCRDGFNRAIARDAFSSLLPREVIERRGKGSPDAFEAQVVVKYRLRIRDMLLNGMLAAEGLIDRPAVERVLAEQGPLRGLDYMRVTDLVDVEAWLQSWADLCSTSSPTHS